MPTNRRFNQTPPDKANELFEKILATSESALKTRERLFAELKEELQLLANLQEEHLFPVLTGSGMQDLVDAATSDNEKTVALLVEIESMPKNSGEFLTRIGELEKIFQQHIRDDKKELIPAVLEVLSKEEAEAVVEKVEDEMASIGEIKRIDSRRAQQQTEAIRKVTDEVADTMRVSAESTRNVVQTMQEALQNSFYAFSELTRYSTGRNMQMLSQPNGETRDLTEEATQNMRAAMLSGTVVARGLQDVSRECFELSQKRMQRNLDGLNDLVRCRSMADLLAIQSSLIRDNVEQTVNNSRRIAELAIQMADEATRNMTVQVDSVERSTQKSTKAA
ncbi:phasin family protein [Microvirga sp. 2YAF29]|uniref:phasin family protein n=1 Tax=Microvirga sp. 2YAF29 TaxID=3233031 RepID=UPI003F9A334C